MKNIKHILVALLIGLVAVVISVYFSWDNAFITLWLVLTTGIFLFNLIMRKSLSMKKYFTSKYNLFTTKVRREQSFEITEDVMFDKVIEVIKYSKFKLIETDKESLEILAIAAMTFKSWGENLYISFARKGDKTIMKFCSATLFQIYSWGKNDSNFDELIGDIEKSLTI